MTKPNLKPLGQVLAKVKPGCLTGDDAAAVRSELASVWDDLQGATDTKVNADKVRDRAENWLWDPPVLSFFIIRHGRLVAGGSTRDPIQRWWVDVQEGRASCCSLWLSP